MEITELLKPTPGYILIDPIEQLKKSDYISTVDTQDNPHIGIVLAVGDMFTDERGIERKPNVKINDKVLYSIAGIENFRYKYKNDPRHLFVVSPFNRILLVIKDSN